MLYYTVDTHNIVEYNTDINILGHLLLEVPSKGT